MIAGGTLRYGTSSWSEKGWRGVFYPEGLPTTEWLRHYGTQFDSVEADVTYYRVPDEKLVTGWRDKLPAGFRMCAKFPRSIVHGGDGERPDPAKVLVHEHVAADLDQFLAAMTLLGDRCGPLVLQFPFFNSNVFADRGAFFARLAPFLERLPRHLRYAVELRNKTWLCAELVALLRRHEVALVLVDLPYMPHPDQLEWRLDLVTTDFAYCRLIGDRNATDELTKTFDRVVLDQSARIARWAALIQRLLQRVKTVYAFANNHFAGHGPATIRELVEAVG